ncbi:hypothetical protein VTJ04DRAFT_6555 [Mycothermus thermophilus]|uniref:uncharacterized protein n=1 Tax=Humicola insolens TaxID=85995 RepID=UPI0037444F3F
MTSRVIIFTGAPENSDIDWNTVKLLSEFQEPIARFAGRNSQKQKLAPSSTAASTAASTAGASSAPSSVPNLAAWRSVPLQTAKITSNFSQSYVYNAFNGPNDFLTTASLSFTSDLESKDATTSVVLSQFYQHSMSVHERLHSSQLMSQSIDQTTSFISDVTTSFISTDPSSQQLPGSIKEPVQFPGSEVIHDLKDIPSAAYLTKIEPQTLTCHLIVGIISISKPRAVQTRWGQKHLVELLVGDETKAGFSITYWLPRDTIEKSPLAGMRPQDIVLLQNVALSVFANKVYGSSLRRDPINFYLLYRTRLDSSDRGGYYSMADLSAPGPTHAQIEKTRRVRDWVFDFVGSGPRSKGRQDTRPRWDMPPEDDTQLVTG